MSQADTIYALASAPGKGGVAVVRVSGSLTQTLTQQIAGTLPAPRSAVLRQLVHPQTGAAIDRALVIFFKGPQSFTGEDVVEFQIHGGRAVLAALYGALEAAGARLAQPGEFSRRAVQQGRLDLTSAEGIADLVAAETEAQRQQALQQMEGALEKEVEQWREELVRLLAHLEAAIDFADDDLPPHLEAEVKADIAKLATKLSRKMESSRCSERLREGVRAAIVGAPNAGKSSLLNRLAAREVAIVTAQAGTTRDVLEVPLDLAGYPLTLADTAGLREAQDIVEQEGVRRALARAEQADFRILVFDATKAADEATLALFQPGDIIILNKADLTAPALLTDWPALPLEISALTGRGMDHLLGVLKTRTAELAHLSDSPALTRARHREVVREVVDHLTRAQEAKQFDLLAEDVRLATRALSRLCGHVATDDLLDVIFRDFCLGK